MITWGDLLVWAPTAIVVLLVAAAVSFIWGLCRVWRHIDDHDRSLRIDAELKRRRKANERIALRRFR